MYTVKYRHECSLIPSLAGPYPILQWMWQRETTVRSQTLPSSLHTVNETADIRHGNETADIRHGNETADIRHGNETADIRHGNETANIRHGNETAGNNRHRNEAAC